MAVFVLDIQILNRFNVFAERPVRLDIHLVNLSSEVYVVDVAGAQIVLQQGVNVADGDTHAFRFLFIDGDINLRRFRGVGGECILDFRHGVHLLENALQGCVKHRGVGAVERLQTIVHTAAGTQTRNGRQLEEVNVGAGNSGEFGFNPVHDGGGMQVRIGSFIPRFQNDDRETDVFTAAAQNGVADNAHDVGNARFVFDFGINLRNQFAGTLHGSAFRQLDVGKDGTLIFIGDK